ncbi:hypothetical protein [Peribacillus kribbensis]|uniref:hypothetical protein n=1 Tax=Peribacillus kribbensis TaxID=356658 RepID=UPI00041B0672|nr:hypothetical protein [Peribacillus kribbensis]
MNRLLPYHEMSLKLLDLIKTSSEETRDEQIEQIVDMLDSRQKFLASILPPYSEEELFTGSILIETEEEITKKLSVIKRAIQMDIQKLQKKKLGSQKYKNPYQSLSLDGMFYDRKN